MTAPGATRDAAPLIAFGSQHAGSGWWKFQLPDPWTPSTGYALVSGNRTRVELWDDNAVANGSAYDWSDDGVLWTTNFSETAGGMWWVYAEGGVQIGPAVLEWDADWVDPPTPSTWGTWGAVTTRGAWSHGFVWTEEASIAYSGNVKVSPQNGLGLQPAYDAGLWGREVRLAADMTATRAAETRVSQIHPNDYDTRDTAHAPTQLTFNNDAVATTFVANSSSTSIDGSVSTRWDSFVWLEHDNISIALPPPVSHYTARYSSQASQALAAVSASVARFQYWTPEGLTRYGDSGDPMIPNWEQETQEPPLLDAEIKIDWAVTGRGALSGTHALLTEPGTGPTTPGGYDDSGTTVLASVPFANDSVLDSNGSLPRHLGSQAAVSVWDLMDHDTGQMRLMTRTTVTGTGYEDPDTATPRVLTKEASAAWTPQVRYLVQNPRYKLQRLRVGLDGVLPPPTVTHAPPLRIHPRSDGLGLSSAVRAWPPPRSQQYGGRPAPGSYL